MRVSLLFFGLLAAPLCHSRNSCDIDKEEGGIIFSQNNFQNLLQNFVERAQGLAFRSLGDPNDFDHGHVLFDVQSDGDGDFLHPFAILWHTQENASTWEKINPRSVYAYLHPLRRNWIQFFDCADPSTNQIYNAMAFVNESFPNIFPYTRFVSDDLPTHHTVHAAMLDPSKFPAPWRRDTKTIDEAMLVFHEKLRNFPPDDNTDPQYDVELREKNSDALKLYDVRRQDNFSEWNYFSADRSLRNKSIPKDFLAKDDFPGPL